MTSRLYYADPYAHRIRTRVLKIWKEGEKTCFIPEATILYPGGGGQPQDIGYVDGKEVVEIREEGKDLIHVIEGEVGEEVEISVDWEVRYMNMKLHTGQHLLSAIALESFGWNTLSFSISGDHASIEVDVKKASWQQIEELERKFLRYVERCIPVIVYWVDEKAAESLEVRKKTEVKGPVRVVEIEGIDRSLCKGTHVKSTGELGLVVITEIDKVRGNTRLYFAISDKALEYLQGRREESKKLISSFSWEEGEFSNRVEKLLEEKKNLVKEKEKTEKLLLELLKDKVLASEEKLFQIDYPAAEKAMRFLVKKMLEHQKKGAILNSVLKKLFLSLPEGEEKVVAALREEGFKGGGSRGFYEFLLPEKAHLEEIKSFIETIL